MLFSSAPVVYGRRERINEKKRKMETPPPQSGGSKSYSVTTPHGMGDWAKSRQFGGAEWPKMPSRPSRGFLLWLSLVFFLFLAVSPSCVALSCATVQSRHHPPPCGGEFWQPPSSLAAFSPSDGKRHQLHKFAVMAHKRISKMCKGVLRANAQRFKRVDTL